MPSKEIATRRRPSVLKLENAKRIVHGPSLGNRDQLLVLLAIEPVGPFSVKGIKTRCTEAGLPKLVKRKISPILSNPSGSAARPGAGWELQQPGLQRVRELAQAVNVNLVVTHSSQSLRG